MTPTPLLDASGVADLLNVPKTWVLAEARADRIPHVRLGRYVRFDPDELCEWWQTSRRRGPKAADLHPHDKSPPILPRTTNERKKQ